jgi:hypothetical protein
VGYRKRLEFVDEPPIKVRPPKAEGFAALVPILMQNQDKWAIVAEDVTSSTASTLRSRYPDFEFTVRAPTGKKYTKDSDKIIWGCFRGIPWQLAQAAKKNA